MCLNAVIYGRPTPTYLLRKIPMQFKFKRLANTQHATRNTHGYLRARGTNVTK